MDRGARPPIGPGVAKSRTGLEQLSKHILDSYLERELLGWRGRTHVEPTASATATSQLIWKT